MPAAKVWQLSPTKIFFIKTGENPAVPVDPDQLHEIFAKYLFSRKCFAKTCARQELMREAVLKKYFFNAKIELFSRKHLVIFTKIYS
jgi:hypothetical protein